MKSDAMRMPGTMPAISTAWAFAAASIVSAVFWLLSVYGDTVFTIVSLWDSSETFAHGYLIAPISAWMIWRRRDELAMLSPQPNFLVLPLLALLGFGWLLAALAEVGVVQQYCLVLMIPLLVWTILGSRVAWALAFPLFFLLFAVPFGEFLLPPLMEHTAEFTISALRLTGIPVYREGLYFTIPSGNWSVVEACSGLRYLIASVTLGFLYAYLTYRSLTRRAIFVVFSVIVPIVANWLRAYMIVMIGHLSSMKYAVGVDHLIYGWLFFGLVMLILFWVGSYWREDLEPPAQTSPSTPPLELHPPSLVSILAATIASAAVVFIWPAMAARLDAGASAAPPVLQAPPAAGGWQPSDARLTDWTPRFLNTRAQINQAYAKGAANAGLYVGYYRNQRRGAQLITSQNTLVVTSNVEWRNAGETRPADFSIENVAPIEAQLRGRSLVLLVWRWYWVDGQFTVNQYWGKVLQAKSKLLVRGDAAAVVIANTEIDTDRDAAARRLRDFAGAMLPGVVESLRNAR
jgi:exosortase A